MSLSVSGGSREQSSCLCLSLVGLVSSHCVSVCLRSVSRTIIMSLSVSYWSREQSQCLCLSQVGLVSSRLHGTFTAVPSQSAAGTLALVRRCQPVTCEGHCTCAPHGHWKCSSTRRCTNVKGGIFVQNVTFCVK